SSGLDAGITDTETRTVLVAEDSGPEFRVARSALQLWPIWAAVGVDLLASLASNTIGWLMVRPVPWIIVAAASGVRRSRRAQEWRWWAGVVVAPVAVVAILTSTVWVTPGNRFTWCMEPWQITSACAIDSNAEASRWKAGIRAIADHAIDVEGAL